MSADGTGKRRIYTLTGGVYAAQPWWSPDAEWLVFQRFKGGTLNLFRIRTDGSDLLQLTSAHDPTGMSLNPTWSP